MANKVTSTPYEISPWKNEFSRQRWELFHRAIAYAKQSNVAAMDESENDSGRSKRPAPILYVAK